MSIASPRDDAYSGELRIAHLLEAVAARDPGAIAILAPGRVPLTYGRLYHHVHDICRTLNGWGVGRNDSGVRRNDRVALVASGGPEIAVAFVAVATSATCAPLNPAYRASEYEFYLSDLKVSALLVQSDLDSPARKVAQQRGLPVIELTPNREAEAGLFTLRSDRARGSTSGEFATAQDTAVVFHTSGTTARPKKVPLTHAHLWSRVQQRVATLELTERDRCLNMMPLYHDSGLQTILATLASGGTILCPPQFDVETFFAWLDEFRPTWYTAVPALQLAILSSADNHGDALSRCALRFIRTATGSLAPHAVNEVERVFAVPVIQSYGMTEVGTICCSPMPPRLRKVGSVGVPAGPDVAIIDDKGARLPAGAIGEVLVRGPNVFRGYEDDPEADAVVFLDGWFRTGDLGMLDVDGYLFLKGRLKDLINRGGEKIPPTEIEEILCAHPAVTEAVIFPLPHQTLGEDVAAAVVLNDAVRATEQELRLFVALRLADFKVPSRVLVVDEIPKGPTGKLRRVDLAEQFAPLLETQFVPPSTPIEKELARIWADLLGVERVGIHDNFFELGGTSLTALRMVAEIKTLTGRNLPLATLLLRAPTIQQLVDVLSQAEAPTQWSSLITIQPKGSRPPFFCMHSVGGNVLYYRDLARHLGSDQPFFALQQQGLDGRSPLHTRIEDMAAHYVREIRAFLPEGPYFLGGHSLGGLIAYEAALQLSAQGKRVALLALIDTFFYNDRDASADVMQRIPGAGFLIDRVRFHLDNLMELELRNVPPYVIERLESLGGKLSRALAQALSPLHPLMRQQPSRDPGPFSPEAYHPLFREIEKHNRQAARIYVPRGYPGRITLFLSEGPQALGSLRSRRMPERLAAGVVETYKIPGGHATILEEPRVRILAEKLKASFDKAIRSARESGSALIAEGSPRALTS